MLKPFFFEKLKLDELVKSQFWPVFVIPAQAGMTGWGTFYEGIKPAPNEIFLNFTTGNGMMQMKTAHLYHVYH